MHTRNRWKPRLAALVLAGAVTATGAIAAAPAAQAVQGSVTGATLEWAVNNEVQVAPPFGGCNYLSAGASDGTQTTYAGAAGNVAIVKDGATPAWANHCTLNGGNANQRFVLLNGTGTLNNTTGATTIQWTGTVSVNFYGGAVPFWLQNPRLTVAANGTGRVTADVGGYASSRDNPNVKVLLPTVPGVVIATLNKVKGANTTGFAITPTFAGVRYNAPSGGAPQNRTTAGWGSWPASFVNFQNQTGLSSYWYTSGSGFDARKAPTPITVRYGAFSFVPSKPSAPKEVDARSGAAKSATGSLTVTYRAPVDGGGTAILGYTARCGPKAKSRAGATPGPITIAGLTAGKRYACTVTAQNAQGSGRASAAAPVIVGSPAPPVSVRAARAAKGRIKVTFKLRANNGSPILGQTATCVPVGGSGARTGTHKGAAAAPIVVAGLKAGKAYRCRVTATNKRGVGLASDPSNATKA